MGELLPRVLLVDDEPLLLRALGRLLARRGLVVETAGDGEAALQRLAEVPVDLIVCDVRMPRLDGPGLLRALGARWAAGEPAVPFVFLTGYGDQSDRELVELGAQAVYGKPLDADALTALVERWVRRA